jgi:hypothetical protein
MCRDVSTATKLMRVASAKWIPHPRCVPYSLDSLCDSNCDYGRGMGGARGRAGDTVRWANTLLNNDLGRFGRVKCRILCAFSGA